MTFNDEDAVEGRRSEDCDSSEDLDYVDSDFQLSDDDEDLDADNPHEGEHKMDRKIRESEAGHGGQERGKFRCR
jgi:hypothetical protein